MNKTNGGDGIPVELFQILKDDCESAALNMPANLENSAVATGLEKVSFHSKPIEKGREFQKDIYFCFIDYAKAFDCADHNKLWKILKEMGILDHLTYLLRNLYAGHEATVRTGHGTTDWFQIGRGVSQGCILSSCLCNSYAEYIMRNAGLGEAQLESRCRDKYQ